MSENDGTLGKFIDVNSKSSIKDISKTNGKLNHTKSAEELAAGQRDIGVAEFFARNKHLLGFDNRRKALMTTIKEAVDNSLDACEEAGILPEVSVEIIELSKHKYRVIVEDNGPGIVKEQVPKIFAKLLYGSKFHSLKQSRGQQGIGISAAVMYGQLTTGRPAKIISKIVSKDEAYFCDLELDTVTNKPHIIKDSVKPWYKDHGTSIQIDLEASYQKGSQSIDQYLKETAIANPHATIIYVNPKAEQFIFPRAVHKLPKLPVEIKPHPYGVDFGTFIKLLKLTKEKTLSNFLQNDFSKVSLSVAKKICEEARVAPSTKVDSVSKEMIERLIKAIPKVKIHSPSADCINPIGAEDLEKGLRKEVNAEFYSSVSRSPSTFGGYPFVVEAAIAYGGNQPRDSPMTLLRYANRVPLLFQQSSDAFTKAATQVSWRNYGISQSKNSLPVAPLTLVLHVASVWIPFTSESKESIAPIDEIMKEAKLAIGDCARDLKKYLAKKKKVESELKKRSHIVKFIPHIADALKDLLGESKVDVKLVESNLKDILEETRGEVEDMSFDASKNKDFDEFFARKKSNLDDEIYNVDAMDDDFDDSKSVNGAKSEGGN